ncbi:MAG: hypothetical protein KatS3mg063_0705 [Tepidiforma sp.]|uniref:carboxylesterase family protein n=1 Tax=Tepidiforma sp. TaxID=2682230 RepID=UPI0021DC1107|nr:carboxylesterase family protein [Tepidiforma sp.]GIW14852.1 MAG: hypothetical protein KatS3mg063_0705 [Tepidiforma sp.]
MMDAWIAFARTGDPSHPGIGRWEPYEEETRPTMVFDLESRLERDPYAEERLAAAALAGAAVEAVELNYKHGTQAARLD